MPTGEDWTIFRNIRQRFIGAQRHWRDRLERRRAGAAAKARIVDGPHFNRVLLPALREKAGDVLGAGAIAAEFQEISLRLAPIAGGGARGPDFQHAVAKRN